MRSVFVGGSPRSGTTLLGAMLGAHSDCLATPESKFNLAAFKQCMDEQGNVDIGAALKQIQAHWTSKIWDVPMGSAEIAQLGADASYPQLIEAFVRNYGAKVGKPDPAVWVDHTPLNITNAPVLFTLFTEAKMIHLVRDGRAVAASVMKLDWGPNTIDAATHWWSERIAHGLAVESFFGPQRVKRVRYEELVREPSSVLREICGFAEIEYQPEMAGGSGFQVPSYSARQHVLIGAAPQVGRIHAWQQELSTRQIEIFESIAGDLLQCLGYELKYGVRAHALTRFEEFRSSAQELYRAKVVNPLRSRRRFRQSLSVPAQAGS